MFIISQNQSDFFIFNIFLYAFILLLFGLLSSFYMPHTIFFPHNLLDLDTQLSCLILGLIYSFLIRAGTAYTNLFLSMTKGVHFSLLRWYCLQSFFLYIVVYTEPWVFTDFYIQKGQLFFPFRNLR